MMIEKRMSHRLHPRAVQCAVLLMLTMGPPVADQAAFAQQGREPSAAGQTSSGQAAGQASGQVAGQTSEQAPQGAPRVNDYPTLARIEYVFECIDENSDRSRHEMVYKCVCTIDRVAEEIPYDRWVELSTFFKAQPMAGERGAYVRERSDVQAQVKDYRELLVKAKKACFIPTDSN